MLKSLELPGFSMERWQSNIRHYAAAHPDYADIRRWPGRETSDLTYQDIQGDLTRLLIDTGHLAGELWRDRRPMYFLEVKTTTGPCHTPFFVSKRQYERVCIPAAQITIESCFLFSLRLHSHIIAKTNLISQICDYKNATDTVYIIFRVFHVDTSNVRTRLFLNPAKMMDDGQLLFTAEKWSVIST